MPSRAPVPLPDATSPLAPRPGGPGAAAVDGEAFARALEALGYDAVLRELDGIRAELSERDGQLCEALARLGELYQELSDGSSRPASSAPSASAAADPAAGRPHDGPPSGALPAGTLEKLLRSVDSLALVTEASTDRAGDLVRSVERMAESLHGLANRVDRLVRRSDDTDARLERLTHVVEALAARPAGPYADAWAGRPPLRAVPAEGRGGPDPG